MLHKATCDGFQKHFQQLHKCRRKCVDTKGQYFEGNYVFDVTSSEMGAFERSVFMEVDKNCRVEDYGG